MKHNQNNNGVIFFASLLSKIILERENHRKLMRKLAANRIIDAIPLDSFRKQFSNTIKAYFG